MPFSQQKHNIWIQQTLITFFENLSKQYGLFCIKNEQLSQHY